MTSVSYAQVYDRIGSLYPSHLQDSEYNNQMGEIKSILDDSTIKIDFWGSRNVVSKEGTYYGEHEPICPVALKEVVYKVLHTQCSEQELDTQKEVVSKLCELYKISSERIENCNFITRVFNQILEFFSSSSSLYAQLQQFNAR